MQTNLTNNTSFGRLNVKGGTRFIRNAIKSDASLQSLADKAEKLYHKDLLVNVHYKHQGSVDTFKPFLSVDKGFFGNFLTKIGLGKKMELCHHHTPEGIQSRCMHRLLDCRNISDADVFKKLNIK